jgi:hypothetical protein
MQKEKHSYKDPLVASVLALVPGAGHLYCGESLRGVTYLAGTVAGLFLFVVPGIFIWAASIPDVVLCVRRRNRLAKPFVHVSAVRITDGPDPECPVIPQPDDPGHVEPLPESVPSPRSTR